jgi:hypothetical protein
MSTLSPEQIYDASGNYSEVAATTGVAFERSRQSVPRPTFREARQLLDREAGDYTQFIVLKQADLLKQQAHLRRLGGLRVLVGAKTADKHGYFPGNTFGWFQLASFWWHYRAFIWGHTLRSTCSAASRLVGRRHCYSETSNSSTLKNVNRHVIRKP